MRTRKRVTFNLPDEMIEKLKVLSDETMIPQSKLVEKAIQDLLEEYEKSK